MVARVLRSESGKSNSDTFQRLLQQSKYPETILSRRRNCRSIPQRTKKFSKNTLLVLFRVIVVAMAIWCHTTGGRRSARRLVAHAWTLPTPHNLVKTTTVTKTVTKTVTPPDFFGQRRKFSGSKPFPSEDFLTRGSLRLFSTKTSVGGNGVSKAKATTTRIIPNSNVTDSNHLSNSESFDASWKKSPLVNPTVVFETLLVPNSQLTKWITHPKLQDKLAKPDNWEFLKHIHPRIKMVQDFAVGEDGTIPARSAAQKYKQLLLLPDSISREAAIANRTTTGTMPLEGNQEPGQQHDWLTDLLSEQGEDENTLVKRGPSLSMSFSPRQLSFQYLLQRLLPESAMPPPSAYEQIGHVAHFNLRSRHLPHKRFIGSALLESTTSGANSIRTVVNKVGKVDGKYRTYECDILANVDPGNDENDVSSVLETTVVEDGVSLELNVAETYWCTRLSGERQELIKDILRGRKIPQNPRKNPPPPPLVVADAFCGVGAVCLLLAKKIKEQDRAWKPEFLQEQHKRHGEEPPPPSLTVLANDWNPKAIEYMKISIALNGMDKANEESLYHTFEATCRDSFDFLSELGEELPMTKSNPYIRKPKEDQLQEVDLEEKPMPDHILMNFPLEAPRFLGALRWWSWKRLEKEGIERGTTSTRHGFEPWKPRFHVYTFAYASSPRANDEDEMAVNLVADELLPGGFRFDVEDDSDDAEEESIFADEEEEEDCGNEVLYRREELDREFGTDFSTRIVRDVAPGKVVVCVSFSVTPKLLRYIQGNYDDF